MMFKTPDETKRELVTCLELVVPRRVQHEAIQHALALIRQLEATVSEKEKVVAELSGKIGQLEVERDAAVAELKDNRICQKCKNFEIGWNEPCLHCDGENNCFEWRGVTKEDGNV